MDITEDSGSKQAFDSIIRAWEYEQRLRSLDRYDLNFEMAISRKKGRITENLGRIFIEMATRLMNRYKLSEDVKKDGINNCVLMACRYWDKFDPERADDAWPFMVQIMKSSFAGFYRKEDEYKRHIEIDPNLTISI